MAAKLTFLGAAGTVTGSKFLVEHAGARILVDCGLFQGFKNLRLKNWLRLPVRPSSIDAVILTHAHIDHSGYLPRLAANGFRGPVYATQGTIDLCEILLPDSGFLQERDAEFANRMGYSKHKPAKPLYTQAQAEDCLDLMTPVAYERETQLNEGLGFDFLRAGHILGSAFVRLRFDDRTLLFTGDIGRPKTDTMVAPDIVREADYLVVESTYGDRTHDTRDPEEVLAEIITRTAARGGTVLIPSFAVGRTQTLLYHIERLKTARRIPDLPVFLDSPMAIDASEIFCRHPGEHGLTESQCRRACAVAQYVRSVDESKAIDRRHLPQIVISASGMATGGRVLHHLKAFAPNAKNTVLFAGFQAGGTRGASMLGGAESVKIHGAYVPVRAEVDCLHMLSAHADRDEIMSWLGHFDTPPRRTFIVHGEPPAADALRHRIEEQLGWTVSVPDYRDVASLS